MTETAKESGCLRYELHQSLEDGRVLVFVESWESEEKWRAHMQGAAMKRFHASGAANLIQDFSLIRMGFRVSAFNHSATLPSAEYLARI
ncbi:MAG TPA: antibiotic biosynthesis monooxygenase [Verrucomicrobiae bacterium]|nr:antibiotic biosynthesis monooxygenase [Verrucomicrobiae bacterium]